MAIKLITPPELLHAKEIDGVLVSHKFPDDNKVHFSGRIDFCWCFPTTFQILDDDGSVIRTETEHHWRQ